MHSDRERLALSDIRDNLELAKAFAEGLSYEQFLKDRRTFYAVMRRLRSSPKRHAVWRTLRHSLEPLLEIVIQEIRRLDHLQRIDAGGSF